MCVKDGLMRIHPWLAALSSVGLLFAAGERSAPAQQTTDLVVQSSAFDEALEGHVQLTAGSQPEESVSEPAQVRGQSPGGPPVVFEPAYTSNNPAALWPSATPPSYQPYPQISPYYHPNVAQTSTYNRQGLWFKEMLFRERKYFMTLEYLMVRYRDPGNSVVGADPARFFRVDRSATAGAAGAGTAVTGGVTGLFIGNNGLGGPAEFGLTTGPTTQRLAVGPGVFPFPFIFQAAAQTTRVAVLDENLFPIRTLGHFDNPLKADGMRARWGYTNEDGSGLMLTGWFGTEGRDRFKMGWDAFNGIEVDQAFIIANSPTGGDAPIFPRNGGLPLLARNDFILGDENTLGYTGETTKFDVLFQYEINAFATGGAMHLYHEPVYKRKWVTVRPTFGARYQYLDERFAFRGIDSGFGYNTSNLGAGGAAGQQAVPTYRPTSAEIFPVTDTLGNSFFYEANLESKTFSHMAGPEAGFRYDFGEGQHFSVWGQSTIALLANHEKIQLTGRNIGDPVNYFEVTGDNFTDPGSGIDTRFSKEEKHTHASPMFEQAVYIDMDVFRFFPLLNKLHVLENARFRTGYTYTVIGSVARPAELIEWRAFPDLPSIRSDQRKTWSTHNWSFAVDWQF